MYWVLEYGDNIGTLKNLFRDQGQAVFFAKKVIDTSGCSYEQIKPYQWYCKEKKETVAILPAPAGDG
jgi:hypothetical protein